MKLRTWHAEARELAAANPGWSNRQIADAIGVTASAVWKVLNPEKALEMSRRSNAQPKRVAQKAAGLDADRQEALERRRARNPIPGQFTVRRGGTTAAVTLVDADVWQRYRHVAWHFAGAGYVAGRVEGRTQYLHRLVLGIGDSGMARVSDHVNRDKLDNRRANLRVVSQRENCANRGGKFAKAADSVAVLRTRRRS
jgi:hypothetical protein